jgi:transposase-like protein
VALCLPHAFLKGLECDESYFGPERQRGVPRSRKRGRDTLKQPVFGIFERSGAVFTEIVPDVKAKTLQEIIRGKISPQTGQSTSMASRASGRTQTTPRTLQGHQGKLRTPPQECEWRWDKNPDTMLAELKKLLV